MCCPEEIESLTLNRHELRMAGSVAIEHHIENVVAGRRDTAWGNGLDLTSRYRAYCAEYAVARFLRYPWEPKVWEHRSRGDVAKGVEVKSVPHREHYPPELPVRPRDLERMSDRPFVLVVVQEPQFHLVGWCYAHEAPELGVERAPDPSKPPALFVPWTALHALYELTALV